MPVAFKTPASPTPPPPASAHSPGATPATPGGGAFDFLALLANFNALAAAVLPSQDATATDVAATSELDELLDPSKEDDATRDSEDDELLAALALIGMPIPAPPPATAQFSDAGDAGDAGDGEASGDAILEALGAAKSGTASLPQAAADSMSTKDLASRLVPQMAAADLLPVAPAKQPDDTLLKSGDATSSTSTTPTHLQTIAAHALASLDPVPRELRAPLGTHAWNRQLGDELAWMMQQGKEAASLKLSPEHLGPIEVRISMRDGEASVMFGASHADTRNALEQALPKLREMFASQGLALADAGVFKEAPRQQSRTPAFNSNSSGVNAATEVSSIARSTAVGTRLLDTYA